jgi:hypothetical protein
MSGQLRTSCEMVASWQRRKHEGRGIYIAESHNLATASEYKLRKLSVCCSEKPSAWINESVLITCSYDLYVQ